MIFGTVNLEATALKNINVYAEDPSGNKYEPTYLKPDDVGGRTYILMEQLIY